MSINAQLPRRRVRSASVWQCRRSYLPLRTLSPQCCPEPVSVSRHFPTRVTARELRAFFIPFPLASQPPPAATTRGLHRLVVRSARTVGAVAGRGSASRSRCVLRQCGQTLDRDPHQPPWRGSGSPGFQPASGTHRVYLASPDRAGRRTAVRGPGRTPSHRRRRASCE